ncbi:hypothetical protein [Lysinibacillus fusiformis]|uniref:hypothetical protein n=1 Tax=Lysinibacillus fusiformis TaxID=28031 RepID=UPI003AACD19C
MFHLKWKVIIGTEVFDWDAPKEWDIGEHGMANNELNGTIVAAFLFNRLKMKNRELIYRSGRN